MTSQIRSTINGLHYKHTYTFHEQPMPFISSSQQLEQTMYFFKARLVIWPATGLFYGANRRGIIAAPLVWQEADYYGSQLFIDVDGEEMRNSFKMHWRVTEALLFVLIGTFVKFTRSQPFNGLRAASRFTWVKMWVTNYSHTNFSPSEYQEEKKHILAFGVQFFFPC